MTRDDGGESEARRGGRGLVALLAIVLALHASVLACAPERRLFGDESGYLARAREDAAAGRASLLPGTLRFDWRPELASRLYASFAGEGATNRAVVRRVGTLNLALVLALLAMVHAHARWLGLGRAGALVVVGALGLFPWFGFYVHALWPEVLHAFLLGAALFGVQRFLVRGGSVQLLLAGVALGYALLAKGSINLFLPVLAACVVAGAFLRERRGTPDDPPRASTARSVVKALVPGACLVAGVLAVVLPQLRANEAAGHGRRLASNRWINVELGLLRPVRSEDEAAGRAIYDRYFADAARGLDAEAEARARVLAHLRERSPLEVASAQLAKVGFLVFESGSFLERVARKDRWGEGSRAWLRVANLAGRAMWYALLAGGAAGLVLVLASPTLRREPGWWILAALAAYFAAALLVAPVKIRFAMPVVPVLAFFCGALVDRARCWYGARFRRAAHSSSDVST